MFDVDEN